MRASPGRPKGCPNKVPALLKDQILQALSESDPEGAVGYLKRQAVENPVAFLSLLGKILPQQVNHAGDDGGPVQIGLIQRVIIDASPEFRS